MARYNKVVLIGRLTRDPETHETKFGKIAKLGFVVNNPKKLPSGEWEDNPCFLDLKAFDGEYSKLASKAAELHKGQQVMIEGKLTQENWEDKNGGGKRSKVVILLSDIQTLDAKERAAPPAPETVTTPNWRNQKDDPKGRAGLYQEQGQDAYSSPF